MNTETTGRRSVNVQSDGTVLSLDQFVAERRVDIDRILASYNDFSRSHGYMFSSRDDVTAWRYRLALVEEKLKVLDLFSAGKSGCDDEDSKATWVCSDDHIDEQFRNITGHERIDDALASLNNANETVANLVQRMTTEMDAELLVLSKTEVFRTYLQEWICRAVAQIKKNSESYIDVERLLSLYTYFGPDGEGSDWELFEYLCTCIVNRIGGIR